MIAKISACFECTEERFWAKILDSSSLEYVSAPILSFRPIAQGKLFGNWQLMQNYVLKMYLFKLIPLGRHRIQLMRIDRKENIIESQESGLLVKTWNHRINFKTLANGLIQYTDEIEIEAGLLTPFFWLFAHMFYRHRQRRWKKLLKRT